MKDIEQKNSLQRKAQPNPSLGDSIVDYFLPQHYKDAIANKHTYDKVDKAKLEVDLADVRPFILSLLSGCFAGFVILFFHSTFIPNNFLDVIFDHYFGQDNQNILGSEKITQYAPHYVLNPANGLAYLTYIKVRQDPFLEGCHHFQSTSENLLTSMKFVDINQHIGLYGFLRRAFIYLVFETPPFATFLVLIAYSKGKMRREKAVIYAQFIIAFIFFILTFVSGGTQSASIMAFLCQISCLGKAFGREALSRLSVMGVGLITFFWYFQSEIPTIPYTIPWLHNYDVCERLLAVGFIYMNTHEFFEEIEFVNTKLKVLLEESESNSAKSVFLATISHEMRTPLLHVQVINNLLIDGIQELQNKIVSAKDVEDNISLVRQSLVSSEMLMTLINDVLDLGKMQSHSLSVDSKEVPVLDVLKKAHCMFEKTAMTKGVNLRTLVSSYSRNVKASLDSKRFLQVLINVIGNAMKFTSKGGNIEIEMDVKMRNFCAVCVLKVSDTGIGIKKDDLYAIFKPFVQVEDGLKTKRQYGGSGLGLAISQKLMKCMEGNISVKSTYGSGSTFIIEFPVIPSEKHNFTRYWDTESPTFDCISDNKVHNPCDNDVTNSVNGVVNIESGEVGLISTIQKTLDLDTNIQSKLESILSTDNFSNNAVDFKNHNIGGNSIDNNDKRGNNSKSWSCNASVNKNRSQEKVLPTPPKTPCDGLSSNSASENESSGKRLKTVTPVKHSTSSVSTPPLPLGSSQTAPSLIEKKIPKKKKKKLKDVRITIVDDNEINCILVAKLMKVNGAIVNHFISGLDALKYFEEAGLPEIIISDIYMPEMDGFELAVAIRSSSLKRFAGKEPFILGLSASTLEDDKNRCLGHGMNMFYQKPFQSDHLINVLRKATNKSSHLS